MTVELTPEQIKEQEALQIAFYEDKIAGLDVKLASFIADKLGETKTSLMLDAKYTADQVERYKQHLHGETEDELKASLKAFMDEIPPARKPYVDANPMNGASGRPAAKDGEQVGRDTFQRIKHKIRGGRIL